MKKVAIVMGSKSDLPVMEEAANALKEFGVSFEINILSAHRTPKDVAHFAESAARKGYGVVIAGAGGAAHLPGMVAAHTEIPVIGVPVPIGALQGVDALHSIVQMPRGVPVATVAIGNAWNAGVLATQILAVAEPKLAKKLRAYKTGMEGQVRKDAKKIRAKRK